MKYSIDFKDRDEQKKELTDEVLYSQEIKFKKNHLEIRFLYYIGDYREQENFRIIKKDSIKDISNPLTVWLSYSTEINDSGLGKAKVSNINIIYRLDDDYCDVDLKFNIEDRKYRDKIFNKIKEWMTK